jgi:hypothetical protein
MKGTMVAYEIYWVGESREEHLIGILPERRRDPKRITQESIQKWGRMLIGDPTGFNILFFATVTIDEDTGNISRNGHVIKSIPNRPRVR